MFTAQDHLFMTRALQLAARGLLTTSPNPRVGCVIVNHGRIVGEGAHLKAGDAHAEVYALQMAGGLAKGATAYVTLEPCSHHGRTPPCADALIKAGISVVVAAMEDPNPLVSGQGLALLRAQGVIVASGLLEAQAKALNVGFIARMTTQRPFVRCKVAATLDGKTALANGESQWITSEASRLDVQHWRARSCAILTGVGTVLADNPRLNVRSIETTRQPTKVIVDSTLKTPVDARLLSEGNTVIVYAVAPEEKIHALQMRGVTLIAAPAANHQVCLPTLLRYLAQIQINELLVEAGQGLSGAMLTQNLVDELLIYYAPKLMGGTARPMFDMPIFNTMSQVLELKTIDVRMIGPDIRMIAQPISHHAD